MTRYEDIQTLLDNLRKEGFSIGVDTHLQIGKVMEQLPANTSRSVLMDYLTPIIARNKEEQFKFKMLFSKFNFSGDHDRKSVGDSQLYAEKPRNVDQPLRLDSVAMRQFWGGGLLIAGLIGLAVFLFYPDFSSLFNSKTSQLPNSAEEVTLPEDSISRKDLEIPQNNPAIDAPQEFSGSADNYRISWTLAIFLAALFIAYLLWKNRKESLLLQNAVGTESPYAIRIKTKDIQSIIIDESFQLAFNRFKRHQVTGRKDLDISATVRATVENAGAIDFRYTAHSKSVQYLFLIDKNKEQNHRSELNERLFQEFAEQLIPATRFFFDASPIHCWNEKYPQGIDLHRISSIYPEAKLLVFADGHNFLDPMDGQLKSRLQLLQSWPRRTLITHNPLDNWGCQEQELSKYFTVEPGFRSVSSLNGERQYLNPASLTPGLSDRQFTPELQQWIAACALYPELHWDLTVKIGQVLSGKGKLVTYANLDRLAQIDWFRKGAIPEKVREELLHHPSLDDESKRKVRKALTQILAENLPQNQQSKAHQELKTQMAVNHLLIDAKEDKTKWLGVYREQHLKGEKEDAISRAEMDKMHSPWFYSLLPQPLAGFLFKEGRPVLGWSSILAFFSFAVLSILCFTIPQMIAPKLEGRSSGSDNLVKMKVQEFPDLTSLNVVPDSVIRMIDGISNSTVKTDLLLELTERYAYSNPQLASYFVEWALDLSTNSNRELQIAMAFFWKARILERTSQSEEQLSQGQKLALFSYATFEKMNEMYWVARTENLLAMINYDLSDYDTANQKNSQALTILQKNQNLTQAYLILLAEIYQTQASINYMLDLPLDSTFQLYAKSDSIYQILGDGVGRAGIIYTLAFLKNDSTADSLYHLSAQLYEKFGNINDLAKVYVEHALHYTENFTRTGEVQWLWKSNVLLEKAQDLPSIHKGLISFRIGLNAHKELALIEGGDPSLAQKAVDYYDASLEQALRQEDASFLNRMTTEISKICGNQSLQGRDCSYFLDRISATYSQILAVQQTQIEAVQNNINDYERTLIEQEGKRNRGRVIYLGIAIFLSLLLGFQWLYFLSLRNNKTRHLAKNL